MTTTNDTKTAPFVAIFATVSLFRLGRTPPITPPNGGSSRPRITYRIPNPTRLTTKNCAICSGSGRERESGYVQYRFQTKLLVTARVKPIDAAIRSGVTSAGEVGRKTVANRKLVMPRSIV